MPMIEFLKQNNNKFLWDFTPYYLPKNMAGVKFWPAFTKLDYKAKNLNVISKNMYPLFTVY